MMTQALEIELVHGARKGRRRQPLLICAKHPHGNRDQTRLTATRPDTVDISSKTWVGRIAEGFTSSASSARLTIRTSPLAAAMTSLLPSGANARACAGGEYEPGIWTRVTDADPVDARPSRRYSLVFFVSDTATRQLQGWTRLIK